MREVKFRAWDKRNNKWFHNDLFILTNSGFYADYREFDDGNSLFDYEYELMQYTGLKDKNGKKIYEGDIVKGKAYEFSDCPRIIGEVIYDYCEYKVKSRREKTSWLKAELNTIYEVIGNIYENPELVKS
jgi:uncharacterized phage protein (TIGR01671 family)